MQMLKLIPFVEVTESHPSAVQPVTVYPTRISLSSWRGCNLKCSYCVLQQDPVSGDPFKAERVSTLQELLAAYGKIVSEAPDFSRLKITINDHTDPFLTPEITTDTLDIVAALASQNIQAPVMITTKLNPGADVVQRLAQLSKQLKLTVFISIADFSEQARVELNNVKARFEALKEFSSSGVHTVLYIKPVGPWTDVASLTEYLSRYEDYVAEVIMAPLKGEGLSKALGVPLSVSDAYEFGGLAEDKVVQEIHAVSPAIKVSRKRSCAVNRRHQISCAPPLFGGSDSHSEETESSDLFANAVSLNGYCEVRPHSTFSGRPDLYLALSYIGNFLDQIDVRWAVIGSMQRAVDGAGDSFDKVNDVDIAVAKKDFALIHEHLKSHGFAPEVYMGCKGMCSNIGLVKTVFPDVIELEKYRSNIRIAVAGVSIDISTKDEGVIHSATERDLAGCKVLVAK